MSNLTEHRATLNFSSHPRNFVCSVRTLSSLHQNQDSGQDSSDDEDGQAFYAGGSEHSGQQVLGPPRSRRTDIVTDVFRSVRQ